MSLLFSLVNDRKTYIIAVLIGLCYTAEYLGFIDSSVRTEFVGILGAGGLATLRHAVSKGAEPSA